MTTGRLALLLSVGLLAGCVDRRFVVQTNVPGAQIYVDGNPIGPSPADARRDYAGYYKFTAVAPGYEPLTQMVRFRARWYDYPPLDFFAEVLYPFRIEDVRVVRLNLLPMRPVNQLELISAADALRARAYTLPPSSVPDEPKGTPSPTPASLPTAPRLAPVPMNQIPAYQPLPTAPRPPGELPPPPPDDTLLPSPNRPASLPPLLPRGIPPAGQSGP
jgi:hypothetical protein